MFESTDSEWVQVVNLDDQATMLKSYKNGDFLRKRKVKKKRQNDVENEQNAKAIKNASNIQ